MPSFYRLALLALPLASRVLSHEEKPKATPTIYADANQAFQDLLNALPEESLHVALNSLNAFKEGVFESDRHGVEHVHNQNPPLATKLIVAAVQDLKKRQTPGNGTSTAAPPPASSEPASSQAPSSEAPSSSQGSAVVVPVPIATTTNSIGQPTVLSSEILSQATASIAIPVTTTDENGSTFVSTATKPAVIFTATDSAGSAFVTTSAVNFAPTAGQVITTTDSKGSTFVTTYTPGGGQVSSVVLITTTGANGQPSVITSYTYVNPGVATNSLGQTITTSTNTAKPGLQTGAANKNRIMEVAVVGGAALAFWI